MADEILSSEEKTKLVVALPTIKFLNEDDCKPYRCMVCGDVAIYHYFATCKHLFCGKCHGIYDNKACPINNCANKAINEISQDKDFEIGVYNLKTYCTYKKYGCKEIVNLSRIQHHKQSCQFTTRNLLPRIWNPKLSALEFDDLKEELKDLKNAFANLQQERMTCNCPNLESSLRKEIGQLRSNFENDLKGVKENLQVDIALHLGEIQEIEKKLREELKKERQDQKLDIDQTIQSKVKEIEKQAETHIDKINTNFANELKGVKEKLQVDIALHLEEGIDRKIQEIGKQLGEVIKKEMHDQKLSTDQTIQSKVKEIEKRAETHMDKVNVDFGNLHKESGEKLRFLEIKIDRSVKELGKELAKEINDQWTNTDSAVKSKLDEDIEIIQKKMKKSTEDLKIELETKLVHHQSRTSNAIQALHDDITKYKNDASVVKRSLDEEIKILQNKIKSSNEDLKLELGTKLTHHKKENSNAIQALLDGITKFKNDDDSQQLFPSTNVQVLNKRIGNIIQHLTEEKSQDFTWKIEGVEEKLRDLISGKNAEITIGYFKVSGSEIEQKVMMSYDSEIKMIVLSTDKSSGQHLTHCKMFQTQVYSLCQINNEIKECIWLNDDSNDEWSGVIPIIFLKNKSPFVIDGSIQIIVRCIPYALLYKSFYSDNGISYWRLNNFKQLKQDALGGGFVHVRSDCFYSMEKGYRMQIGAAFNKIQASFFTIHRKGEYDASLDNELFHNITMIIFDQSDSEQKRHLTEMIPRTKISVRCCGMGKFDYTQLEDTRYLKNDCLLIKVIVEPVHSDG